MAQQIFAPDTISKLRAWRAQAKHVLKEKYEVQLDQYRSQIVMKCRQADIDPVDAAMQLVGILKGNLESPHGNAKLKRIVGKKKDFFIACYYAAAIDVIERRTLDEKKPDNRIIVPDDFDRGDEHELAE